MLYILVRQWPTDSRVEAQAHLRSTHGQCAAVRVFSGRPCATREVLLQPLDECRSEHEAQRTQHLRQEGRILDPHKCSKEMAWSKGRDDAHGDVREPTSD